MVFLIIFQKMTIMYLWSDKHLSARQTWGTRFSLIPLWKKKKSFKLTTFKLGNFVPSERLRLHPPRPSRPESAHRPQEKKIRIWTGFRNGFVGRIQFQKPFFRSLLSVLSRPVERKQMTSLHSRSLSKVLILLTTTGSDWPIPWERCGLNVTNRCNYITFAI